MPQELAYTPDGKPYFVKKSSNGFSVALIVIAVALMLIGAVLFINALLFFLAAEAIRR